jgi:hypothetical protein
MVFMAAILICYADSGTITISLKSKVETSQVFYCLSFFYWWRMFEFPDFEKNSGLNSCNFIDKNIKICFSKSCTDVIFLIYFFFKKHQDLFLKKHRDLLLKNMEICISKTSGFVSKNIEICFSKTSRFVSQKHRDLFQKISRKTLRFSKQKHRDLFLKKLYRCYLPHLFLLNVGKNVRKSWQNLGNLCVCPWTIANMSWSWLMVQIHQMHTLNVCIYIKCVYICIYIYITIYKRV